MEPEIKPVKIDEPPKLPPEPPKKEDKREEPTAPKAEDKPKKGKKKFSIVSDLDTTNTPTTTPPAPPAPPAPESKKEDPDEEYVSGLTDEQKDELAEADYAERLFPDKYKGRRKKLIDWYRKVDDTVTKLRSEDPDRTLDEKDSDFQRFLATKPKIESAHAKKVQRTMGEDAAARRVRQELEPKLTEMERKQQEMEYAPKVESVLKDVESGVDTLLEQDEKSPVHEALKGLKSDNEALRKYYRLEEQIIAEERKRAADTSREYLMIAKGLRPFDANNEHHARILEFIKEQGRLMMQADPKDRVREGREFLPRHEFVDLLVRDPKAAEKHWTFSHRNILEMLAWQAKIDIEARIKEENDRAAELGWTRPKPDVSASKPKQAAPSPTPVEPPKATPTPAKGDATIPPKPNSPSPVGDPLDVVQILGLKD